MLALAMADAFPSVEQLRLKLILRTLATAVFVAPGGHAEVLEGWDGDTFLLNNGSGDAGAITFRGGLVVGGFFAHESPRSPYDPACVDPDWRRWFVGAPAAARALAEAEALQFLLQDVGPEAIIQPVITTAVWSAEGVLCSPDDWPSFTRHSAGLLEVDLDLWELPPAGLDLVITLATRRGVDTSTPMALTDDERTTLFADGRAGRVEARDLLASIGVQLG